MAQITSNNIWGVQVTDSEDMRALAKQFRKLGDLCDGVAEAIDSKDNEKMEAALKDFTWEFLKMQKM